MKDNYTLNYYQSLLLSVFFTLTQNAFSNIYPLGRKEKLSIQKQRCIFTPLSNNLKIDITQ